MAVRLTSVDELKILLRVPAAETGLDVRLATIIEEVSDECERWTSRKFTSTGYSNEVYPGGAAIVVLRQRPVDPNSTFQVKDVSSSQTIIFDPSDYSADYDRGIVRLLGGLTFNSASNAAQVTYTAGYVSSGASTAQKITVPGDLSRSVRKLAAAIYYNEAGIIDTKTLEEVRTDVKCIWSTYR
jgi:hypothetical protein